MSMFLYFVMACYGACRSRSTRARGDDGARARAHRRDVHLRGALDRRLLGPAHVGHYWVWDARMTSELVLLFLYFGFIALANAFEDPRRGDRAAALLALIGVVNLPIIYFSVQWWNTLHQGSSVSFKGTSMHVAMLWGMLLMAFACWMYAIGAALVRVRSIILERERRTAGCARWERRMSHDFFIWMSYGAHALALVAEMIALRVRPRARARAIEEERELEAQD
jgi:heme exporter protein C